MGDIIVFRLNVKRKRRRVRGRCRILISRIDFVGESTFKTLAAHGAADKIIGLICFCIRERECIPRVALVRETAQRNVLSVGGLIAPGCRAPVYPVKGGNVKGLHLYRLSYICSDLTSRREVAPLKAFGTFF